MQSLSTVYHLDDADYNAIEAAVMETSRGRWFLAEYARRNRNADTEAVLAALQRIERLLSRGDSTDDVARGMEDIARAIAAVDASKSSAADEEAVQSPQSGTVSTGAVSDELAGCAIEAGSFPIIDIDDEGEMMLAHSAFPDQSGQDSLPLEQPSPQPADTPANSLSFDTASLVTFIEDDPESGTDSVFNAPLRLERDEGETADMVPDRDMPDWPLAADTALPAIALADIEAMSFARKAALFS